MIPTIFISLVVFVIVAVLIYWILKQIPMPEPINLIVRIVIGIILIFVLLNYLGIY